jgi:hypothetical protein
MIHLQMEGTELTKVLWTPGVNPNWLDGQKGIYIYKFNRNLLIMT